MKNDRLGRNGERCLYKTVTEPCYRYRVTSFAVGGSAQFGVFKFVEQLVHDSLVLISALQTRPFTAVSSAL